MNQLIQIHQGKSIHTHDDFLKRFRKNLLKELRAISSILTVIMAFVKTFLLGAVLFIFEFELFKEVLSIIFPSVAIFLIGYYLTLLPFYIVFPLACIPAIMFPLYEVTAGKVAKRILGFLGVAMFFSLFIVFLM